MIDFQSIMLTMTVYLSGLAAIMYLLIFIVLPTKKVTQSDLNAKLNISTDQNFSKVVYGDSTSWKYLRTTILKIQGDRCLCCGTKAEVMHIDHIKPKSRYPHLEYMIDNLQVLCPKCNREKSYTRETDYRKSDHLIALVREVKKNKLLLRKYTYNLDVLESLATKRFNAEMRNKEYPRILPIV